MLIYHLFPEDVLSRPDFAEKAEIYRDYQLKVLGEDTTMIESMQRAMKLASYRPGRMSVMEKPLHHYLKEYCRRIAPEEFLASQE